VRFIWWLVVLNLLHPRAVAFVAGEIRPGIIELRSEAKGGLRVSGVLTRLRGRNTWIYFCVVNQGSARRKHRCFYGKRKNLPQIRDGRVLQKIEYALSPRIHNQDGRIAIGPERYFYPVKRLGTRGLD
jgi:hypothetical protein